MYSIIPLRNGKDQTTFNSSDVVFAEKYEVIAIDMIRKYGCSVVVAAHYNDFMYDGCMHITPTRDRLLFVPTKGSFKVVYQKICPATGIVFGDELIRTITL